MSGTDCITTDVKIHLGKRPLVAGDDDSRLSEGDWGGDERGRIISSEEDGWFNASALCTFLNNMPHKHM